MQNRLALFWPACFVAFSAMFFDLRNMSTDRAPPFDLPGILFRNASTEVIATIPLEPAMRIVLVNPAFLFPNRKRLTGAKTIIIQLAMLVLITRAFDPREPRLWQIAWNKSFDSDKIRPAKNPEPKHLFWRKVRFERGIKISSDRLGKRIVVFFLKSIRIANFFWRFSGHLFFLKADKQPCKDSADDIPRDKCKHNAYKRRSRVGSPHRV